MNRAVWSQVVQRRSNVGLSTGANIAEASAASIFRTDYTKFGRIQYQCHICDRV
jgi:hypothetical protein